MTERRKIEPAYLRPREVARYLALSLAAFRAKLPELQARGFPPADPTTGNFDLEAINHWRCAHNSQLLQLTTAPTAPDASVDEILERAEAGWVP